MDERLFVYSLNKEGFMKKLALVLVFCLIAINCYADDVKVIAKFIDNKLYGTQLIKSDDLGHSSDDSNSYNEAIRWITGSTTEIRSVQVFDKSEFKASDFEKYVPPAKPTEREKFDEFLNDALDNDTNIKNKIKDLKNQ